MKVPVIVWFLVAGVAVHAVVFWCVGGMQFTLLDYQLKDLAPPPAWKTFFFSEHVVRGGRDGERRVRYYTVPTDVVQVPAGAETNSAKGAQ